MFCVKLQKKIVGYNLDWVSDWGENDKSWRKPSAAKLRSKKLIRFCRRKNQSNASQNVNIQKRRRTAATGTGRAHSGSLGF